MEFFSNILVILGFLLIFGTVLLCLKEYSLEYQNISLNLRIRAITFFFNLSKQFCEFKDEHAPIKAIPLKRN